MHTTVGAPAPIERRGAYWVARDDTYAGAGGVYGAKARVMEVLACRARVAGYPGVVAAVARNSSIPNVVARVARAYGLACHLHTADAAGDWRGEGEWALAAQAGAMVSCHRPGYMNVIAARAREDTERHGYLLVPFGLADEGGVEATTGAVGTFPYGVRRLVVPCGSGAMLSGILHGLGRTGQAGLPVLAVCVGGEPGALDRFAPPFWRGQVTLVHARTPFYTAAHAEIDGLVLDPYYEAKCLPFLEPGDCLWVVARRSSLGVPPCAGPS